MVAVLALAAAIAAESAMRATIKSESAPRGGRRRRRSARPMQLCIQSVASLDLPHRARAARAQSTSWRLVQACNRSGACSDDLDGGCVLALAACPDDFVARAWTYRSPPVPRATPGARHPKARRRRRISELPHLDRTAGARFSRRWLRASRWRSRMCAPSSIIVPSLLLDARPPRAAGGCRAARRGARA